MKKIDLLYNYLKQITVPKYKNDSHKNILKQKLLKKIKEPAQKQASFFSPPLIFSFASLFIIILIIATSLLLPFLTPARPKSLTLQQAPQSDQAVVIFLTGNAYKKNEDDWEELKISDMVIQTDLIRTEADSLLELQFSDNALVRIKENTEFSLNTITCQRTE